MTTPFIHDDFLLESKPARELYHRAAADQPIIDYHCHLPPADLAANRQFSNLYEIWLEGDHYKWRAIRANGIGEAYCTGEADPYDKFLAFAKTVPATLRNPLFHWTHLELKRYFGIDTLLNEESAPEIWEEANRQLAQPSHSAWGILEQFKVQFIGTTDDPIHSLEHHRTLASSECPARVGPTFRPDPAFGLGNLVAWNNWVDELEKASGQDCDNLNNLLNALDNRMTFFHEMGCLASDHGLERCPESIAPASEAAETYLQCRSGQDCADEDLEGLVGYLLAWLGERYAEREWVMQLHLGPTRGVNTGLLEKLGADIGCDSIGDFPQVDGLQCILGELSRRDNLPKTILYNINPSQNYAFATMCGNFSEEGVPGKMQFGSGWWFLDQLEGMTWQLNALSNLGLLRHFVGMLTDSRSFMSFPRHEYFRRLLCNLIGQDVEKGLIPDSPEQNELLVSAVCHHNASHYFQLNSIK
jgi:glucuronate isomerase